MAIIVEGQGSLIANSTGGVYTAFVDPAQLSQVIGEAIVGAIVRRRDSFRVADIIPSPEIAKYVLIQPSHVAIPEGESPFQGSIAFRVSLRAPFNQLGKNCCSTCRGSTRTQSCARTPRTRTIEGAIRAVVDGGIIGQIFVQIQLPLAGTCAQCGCSMQMNKSGCCG